MENRQGGEKPRVIYNRDIPKLERVNVIMKEVCRLEERMAWQKDRAYNVTRRLTGMPTAHGGESGLDATLAALSALTEDYGEKVRSYTREIRTAERILSEISSETMRVFVRMFYVDNLPAAQVWRELHMSEYGFARARNAVEQAQDMNSVIWRERYMVDEKAENLSQNT